MIFETSRTIEEPHSLAKLYTRIAAEDEKNFEILFNRPDALLYDVNAGRAWPFSFDEEKIEKEKAEEIFNEFEKFKEALNTK